MGWSSICKLLQKQIHDILSQRYGLLTTLLCCFLLLFSAFQFGEVMLEWSTEKYAAVFNSFSDNIAGKSFRNRLCLPVPIDVVYTWVNGTDPKLLQELNTYKHSLGKLNATSSTTRSIPEKCDFANCVPAYAVVINPALPSSVSLSILATLYSSLKPSTRDMTISSTIEGSSNVTAVFFSSKEQADVALNETIVLDGKNASIHQAYYTSDFSLPNAVSLKDTLLVSGLPTSINEEQVLSCLPSSYKQHISKVELHTEKGVAILLMSESSKAEALSAEKNITYDGKALDIKLACFLWDTHDYSSQIDVSASRYEDNEELRYSLRSIEKFAPWVRHVYLVTNGQIPSWLNLDNPRLTVITHEDIFPNKSHLPTFASPAIESHLHRIPGLSEKFIYLNDDVMFGKEVWPDDFYTHSRGQKIYFAWPMPNCEEGCPASWIRDGYCDAACNNSKCEWDGGDCDGGARPAGVQAGIGGWAPHFGGSDGYCNSGCANNWIADKYCDQACNVKPCGFDAGDCGKDNFHLLHEIKVNSSTTKIHLPQGVSVCYLNLTSILCSEGKITEGSYNEAQIIRSVAVAKKYSVVTVVMAENCSATEVNITVTAQTSQNQTLLLNYTITADTRPVPKPAQNKTSQLDDDAKDALFKFEENPLIRRSPERADLKLPDVESHPKVNLSLYDLPSELVETWKDLLESYKNGELTEKGFLLEQNALWDVYVELLAFEGKSPQLRKVKIEDVQNENGKAHDRFHEVQNDENNANEAETEEEEDDEVENDVHEDDAHVNIQDEPQRHLDDKNPPLAGFDGAKLVPDLVNIPRKAEGVQQVLDQPEQPAENQRIIINHAKVAEAGKEEMIDGKGALEDIDNQEVHNIGRQLNSARDERRDVEETLGLLPWEKDHSLDKLQLKLEAEVRSRDYVVASYSSRRLLDTFADSLHHVNHLFNKRYGYIPRKVLAHMPHMIDKNIMTELQESFPSEWDATSSHRIRSSTDMQYAFSYFYYLISEPHPTTVGEVFDEMDVDQSGILSDREIRTLATRLFELPLDLMTLTGLEAKITNCSTNLPPEHISEHLMEKYYDKNMPQVTKNLVANCEPMIKLLSGSFKGLTKYKHETVGDEEIGFHMIRTNVSQVVGQLDKVRKQPKKFICLNDNIDHTKEEAKTVKAVLQDFYESILPKPSSFELHREYRNRFLHLNELREWRRYRDWLKWWTQVALVLLVIFTIGSYVSEKLEGYYRRHSSRRSVRDGGGLVVRLPMDDV